MTDVMLALEDEVLAKLNAGDDWPQSSTALVRAAVRATARLIAADAADDKILAVGSVGQEPGTPHVGKLAHHGDVADLTGEPFVAAHAHEGAVVWYGFGVSDGVNSRCTITWSQGGERAPSRWSRLVAYVRGVLR